MKSSKLSTKQHIRLTAEKLFRQKGYAAIGMRELASKVGIEAPSIYNHYRSKEELLREICFDMAEQFFQVLTQAETNYGTATQKLSCYIMAHVSVIANNLEAFEVFFNEWVFLQEPYLSKFKKLRSEYEMKFREVVEEGIAAGQFKNINPKLATFTIFSSLNATQNLITGRERLKANEIGEAMVTLLIQGIKQ